MSNPICFALLVFSTVMSTIVPTNDLENELVKPKSTPLSHSRDNKSKHHQQVLTSLLDEPRRAEQNDNDVKTENHCQKLSLKDRKVESGDDDIGESSQATCW